MQAAAIAAAAGQRGRGLGRHRCDDGDGRQPA